MVFTPGSSTTWVCFFLNDLTQDLFGPQNLRTPPALHTDLLHGSYET